MKRRGFLMSVACGLTVGQLVSRPASAVDILSFETRVQSYSSGQGWRLMRVVIALDAAGPGDYERIQRTSPAMLQAVRRYLSRVTAKELTQSSRQVEQAVADIVIKQAPRGAVGRVRRVTIETK
ncbi:MAG: hypothetical protein HQ481_20380 [Alphaproteobacteria bacterium]|nr:hypothetical protein [Alphaproteobacteria bacterium]